MIGFDFSSPWLAKHRGFAYAIPILFVGIAAIVIDYMARIFMAEPIGLLRRSQDSVRRCWQLRLRLSLSSMTSRCRGISLSGSRIFWK
jgi:hypothetical protein